MRSLFLYSLILLVSYIKSQVSITINNSEFGNVNSNFFHYLLNLTVNNLTSSLSSITITNTNDSSDSYKCNCGQAEKFYFCYLNSNNKIDSTKEFTITQYNSRSYNSGTPFHFSDESSVFVSGSFNLLSTQTLYKYYQDSVSFSIESSFSNMFIFSTLSNITVTSTKVPNKVLLNYRFENNMIICSFDNSTFKENEELTFTFTSLYSELNFNSVKCNFDVTQINSISNNLQLSNKAQESITFTLIITNNQLSDSFKSHLYLNAESSDNSISLNNACNITNNINLTCTVNFATGEKYYLYFDNKEISSLYIVIYRAVENSVTEQEIRIGELYIKDVMILTFSPRLNPKDISSIYFNQSTYSFKGVISKNYQNGTVVFGIKYENVTSQGTYKLTFKLGESSFTSSSTFRILGTIPRPKFVQYIGAPDSHITVNDNTSCVIFIFNTTSVDQTNGVTNIKMVFPPGGKVSNCTSYPFQVSSSILYGQICNVTAIQAGFAIFEYNVYGKKETVPLTFPIAEEVISLSSSSFYLHMNILMSLIVLLLIKF